MKCDHRSNFFSNLINWKEEAWKNQGFNGIRTRDHRSNFFSNLINWKEEAWKNQGFNGIRTRDLPSLFTFIYNRGTNMNYFI